MPRPQPDVLPLSYSPPPLFRVTMQRHSLRLIANLQEIWEWKSVRTQIIRLQYRRRIMNFLSHIFSGFHPPPPSLLGDLHSAFTSGATQNCEMGEGGGCILHLAWKPSLSRLERMQEGICPAILFTSNRVTGLVFYPNIQIFWNSMTTGGQWAKMEPVATLTTIRRSALKEI